MTTSLTCACERCLQLGDGYFEGLPAASLLQATCGGNKQQLFIYSHCIEAGQYLPLNSQSHICHPKVGFCTSHASFYDCEDQSGGSVSGVSPNKKLLPCNPSRSCLRIHLPSIQQTFFRANHQSCYGPQYTQIAEQKQAGLQLQIVNVHIL